MGTVSHKPKQNNAEYQQYISSLCDNLKKTLNKICQESFAHYVPAWKKNQDALFANLLIKVFESLLCKCWWDMYRKTITEEAFSLNKVYNDITEAAKKSDCFKYLFAARKKQYRVLKNDDVIKEMQNFIDKYTDSTWFHLHTVGILFEEFTNKRISIADDIVTIVDSIDKKADGVYFTNASIITFIVEKALYPYEDRPAEELLQIKLIDPSMGAGFFLAEAVNQLAEMMSAKAGISLLSAKRQIVSNCVYGVDKNPLAVDIAIFSLWLDFGSNDLSICPLSTKLLVGDSLLFATGSRPPQPGDILSNWRTAFPDVFCSPNRISGFDAVIGNPPWGKIKSNIKSYLSFEIDVPNSDMEGHQLKEYISTSMYSINWEKHKRDIKSYSKLLKQSGLFSHQRYEINNKQSGGDEDLYRYFLELSYFLLAPSGTIGLVIPASFYLSESATGLRHLYFENGQIDFLINFSNGKKIFPIHPSFKFVVLIYRKAVGRPIIRNALFNATDPNILTQLNPYNCISYDMELLRTCSGEYLTIPEVDRNSELDVLRKLYRAFPLLGEKLERHWNISFQRELDMTADSNYFTALNDLQGANSILGEANYQVEDKLYLPVFEGRMVHQYNCARKAYQSGSGRTAKWKLCKGKSAGIIAHYYIDSANADKIPGASAFRAGYCDVTGQHNVRTVLATLIPHDCVCGNKVPVCVFDQEDIRLPILWISIANSFIVDWIVRKKMTTTLNFFHWAHIPFPRLDVMDNRAKTLVLNAAKLLTQNPGMKKLPGQLSQFYTEEEMEWLIQPVSQWEKAELRVEIECIVASLYGLEPYELALILLSFPGLDKGQATLKGDTRYNGKSSCSYVTRDYVLHEYLKSRDIDASCDIVQLYALANVSLEPFTGDLRNLKQRLQAYRQLGAVPYHY